MPIEQPLFLAVAGITPRFGWDQLKKAWDLRWRVEDRAASHYAVSWPSLQSRGSQTPVSIRPSLGDPGKVWASRLHSRRF